MIRENKIKLINYYFNFDITYHQLLSEINVIRIKSYKYVYKLF